MKDMQPKEEMFAVDQSGYVVQSELSSVYNKCCVLGLDKDQDHAACGRVEGEFDWFMGFDGHGGSEVINAIRELDLHAIARQPDSLAALAEAIEARTVDGIREKRFNTGSTYYEAKCYPDRVDVSTCGDSRVAVLIDGELVHLTTPHNMDHPMEKERLAARMARRDVYTTQSNDVVEMFEDCKLRYRKAFYVHFENGTKIAMTQALGHQNITGRVPDRVSIPILPGQKVCVIGGSDGFWDMVNITGPSSSVDKEILWSSTVEELAELVSNRYEQEWTLHWKKEREYEIKVRLPKECYDDVSVCKYFL